MKKQKQRGFTLVETLVVVGLIVVLLGIAIPSVVAIQRDLQMSELDDTARQIALSVQNRLTTLKATGELDEFGKDMATLGHSITTKPVDYTLTDEQWKQLYYLESDADADAALIEKYLMGEGSVLGGYVESGSFILELSPDTGDVYGVFYATHPIAHTDVEALDKAENGRTRKNRQPVKIGYYGGFAEVSASSSLPTKFTPELTVVNKEDLYLQVKCGDLRPFFRTQRSLKLQLSVVDEQKREWKKEYNGGVDFTLNAFGELNHDILLDSLRTGEDFKTITENKLTPGDDLKITATLLYENAQVSTGSIRGEATTTTNSLFATKTTTAKDTTLAVGYLRHLNNLRLYSTPGKKLEVTQTAPIDFDGTTWKEPGIQLLGPGQSVGNPLAAGFPAIENTGIGAYNGSGFELRNFVFTKGTTAATGLFGTVENCAFQGVRLVDCAATGSDNVGLLAGILKGGSVTDCRAHLSTKDASDRDREDMAERVERYCVSGNRDVGGLVGQAFDKVDITGSFAAVKVDGIANIGGMVGFYNDGTITGCYGSGAVTATGSAAGGLVGNLTGGTVTNCYSSSDVIAPKNAGGLAGGNSNHGNYTDCYTYGRVCKADGTVDKNTSGPLVSNKTATATGCGYLQQGDYNEYGKACGTAMGFAKLKERNPTPNSTENSHPYRVELVGNVFPFPLLPAGETTTLPHYGNWPAELTLQTSLVYYERYDDKTYGYYAKTSLTGTGAGDGADKETNAWLVDTLQPEGYCVEDGYAIMTIFKPDKFTYTYTHRVEDKKGNVTYPSVTKMLTAVPTVAEAGPGKAALITSNASMVFRKGDLTYTIANARVYQLPFDLQITDRSSASSFYDQVKMTATVTGREEPLFKDFIFYYCPDFAKNAINPDPDPNKQTSWPENPHGADKPVFVRSPRQLNGLSRATYYWNKEQTGTGTAMLDFYFKQELDLNYGAYTTKYCGETYNLMDTKESNTYRNRPIGRPFGAKGSQFRNIYDGCGNQIVDYCCTTYGADNDGLGYQFTGLFGEIRYATLKNINLVASNPGDEETPSTGYVESRHNNPSLCSGTGALVGLIYVDLGEKHEPDKVARVQNCSVSGYEVRYRQPKHHAATATGGLAGYNFGLIENCAVSMKLVEAGQTTSDSYIGGVAGSLNGKGSIVSSYAGGTLRAVPSASEKVSYGGVCGGFLDIYGYGQGDANMKKTISDSYSYCTWEKENLPVGTAYAVAPKAKNFTITNCCYLRDTVGEGVTLEDGTVKDSITPCTFEQLSVRLPDRRADSANSHPYLSTLQGHPYPFPAVVTLPGSIYCHFGDWPDGKVAVQSAYLTYYEEYTDKTFGYYYLDGRTEKAMPVDKLDRTNSKIIQSAGYGILQLRDAALPTLGGTRLTETDVGKPIATPSIAGNSYDLRPFTDAKLKALAPKTGNDREVSFGYSVAETDKPAAEKTATRHLNVNYGAALSHNPLPATAEKPLEIRTPEQLQRMTGTVAFRLTHSIQAPTGRLKNEGYSFDGGYVAGGADNTTYGSTVGGNGNYIFGLTQPLFEENSGDLKNIALIGVDITSAEEEVAALALENSGRIENCFAKGNVTATRNDAQVAGLVLENDNGSLQSVYFSGSVTAKGDRAQAAGLVGENEGSLNDAYTAGAVTTKGRNSEASGLVSKNEGGSIIRCYTIAAVNGVKALYGIAPKDGEVTDCYWLTSKTFNSALTPGAGTDIHFAELRKKDMGGVWRTDNTVQSYPDKSHGTFPYPHLKDLDHYGDWALTEEAVRTGRVGAAVGGYCLAEGDYRANGQYVKRADSSQATAFSDKPYELAFNETVLVFFEGTEDIGDWTVIYNGQQQTLSAYGETVKNMPDGLTAYRLNSILIPYNGRKLELSKEDESYTFVCKDSNFTYVPTP